MYVRKKRDHFTMGNKPMTKKRWKNKQFFFLLEIKKQVENVFELCNIEKQTLYAVLLTNGQF